MFNVDTADIENLGVLPKELARDLVSRESFEAEYQRVLAPWVHSPEDTLWIMEAAPIHSYEYWLHAFSGLPEVLTLLLEHWHSHLEPGNLGITLDERSGAYDSEELYRAVAKHLAPNTSDSDTPTVLTPFVANFGYGIASSFGHQLNARLTRAHLFHLFIVKKVSFTQALSDPVVMQLLKQPEGQRRLLSELFSHSDVNSMLEAYRHPDYQGIWLENFSTVFSRRRFDVVYKRGVSTICSDLGQLLASFANNAEMHAAVSQKILEGRNAVLQMLTSLDDLFGAPKAVIQAVGEAFMTAQHPGFRNSKISNGTIRYLSAYGVDGTAVLDVLARLGLEYTLENYLAAPQAFATISNLSFRNPVQIWRELYFRAFRDGEVLDKNEKRFLERLSVLFSCSSDRKLIQLRPDEMDELNAVMYSSLEALVSAPNAVKLALPYFSDVKAARRIAHLLIENANSDSFNKSLASSVLQGTAALPYCPDGAELESVRPSLVSFAVLIELGMRTLNGGVLNSNEREILVESIEMATDSLPEWTPLLPDNTSAQWEEFLLGVANATSYPAALWLGSEEIFQEIFRQVFKDNPDLPGIFVARISEEFKDSTEAPHIPRWFLDMVLTGPMCRDVPFRIVAPWATSTSSERHILGVLASDLSGSHTGLLQALELLPSWEGSIAELVDTVRSAQG